MTDRLAARFAACAAENRAALITFITAGDPDLATCAEIMRALVAAGADAIELGMPFTDPMADGASIQLGKHEVERSRVYLEGRCHAVQPAL